MLNEQNSNRGDSNGRDSNARVLDERARRYSEVECGGSSNSQASWPVPNSRGVDSGWHERKS